MSLFFLSTTLSVFKGGLKTVILWSHISNLANFKPFIFLRSQAEYLPRKSRNVGLFYHPPESNLATFYPGDTDTPRACATRSFKPCPCFRPKFVIFRYFFSDLASIINSYPVCRIPAYPFSYFQTKKAQKPIPL